MALTVCTTPGCPNLTPRGRCQDCRRKAEQARGSSAARGYDHAHETRFRQPVLRRDPVCVLCREAPSVHADHYPLSRRQLVAKGMDPNDPKYGRGLCAKCHSSWTAQAQPGGFARDGTTREP